MTMLANTPDPKLFTDLWVIAAFLLGVAVNVVALVMVGRKQKREVSFSFEPASKEDFDAHIAQNVREHENLFAKIGGVERGISQRLDEKLSSMQDKAEEGREKLHSRLNEMLGEMRELKGEMKRHRH